MTFASFVVSVESEIEAAGTAVVSEAKTLLSEIEGVYVNDVKPEVLNLVNKVLPDEVAALTPYAKEAFQEIVTDIPAFLTGGIEAFVAAVGPMLAATFAKATAAGIAVAKTDALAAVTAVASDVKADFVATATGADAVPGVAVPTSADIVPAEAPPVVQAATDQSQTDLTGGGSSSTATE
jgi:hypothetical protein